MAEGMKWILACVLIASSANSQDVEQINAALKCSSENNQFAFDLYDVLRQQKGDGGNMLVSPLSLRTIMAMLQAGSEGLTAKEIQVGMRFPENNTELFRSYTAMRTIGDYLRRKDGKPGSTFPVTIEEANRVYIKKGLPIKTSFQAILKHHFQSPLAQIDFVNGKKAAAEINAWVSDQTQNKINRLIESDSLNNQTKLVLVNTLYFKGPWDNRFHGRATQKQEFHNTENVRASVDMMNIEGHFNVENIEDLNAKAIVLPYEGKRFQFLILLPNERFGLKEMEAKFTQDTFSQIFEKLGNSRLKFSDLSIPKFSIESSFDLIDTLKVLNMETLFNEKTANFKGIADLDEKLFVNKLVQKTFLTVSEQGSEAGAATFAAIFTPLSIGPTLEENVVVDHPFMGFIYDTKMNLILFAFRKSSF